MILKRIFLSLITLFLVVTVFCQDKNSGTISGMVKDAHTKLPLIEAVVTLKSNAFEGQKFTLTDSSGVYKVTNLPEGTYTITFEMEGYKKFIQENIVLKQGGSLGVSFQMVKEGKIKTRSLKVRRDSSVTEAKSTEI